MTRARCWRGSLALGALAAGLAYGSTASAQTPATGWALNRYEPSPVGDAFFLAEHPWYRSTRLFAAGITLDYAANPLSLTVMQPGQAGTTTQSVVSGMLTGHLGVAISPFSRLGIHLSFPVVFSESGSASPVGVAPSASVAPGDLRAGIRVRLIGDADRDPFSLHLGAVVFIPTGSPADNTGDGSVRFEPRLVLAGRASLLRWSFGAGFHIRSNVSALNLAVGNELRFTAAVGLALLDDRLNIGPEAYVFSSLGNLPNGGGSAAFGLDQSGAEVMLGARFLIADAVQVGLAGGAGLGQGYGVPAARGIFSIAYAPVTRSNAHDTDADGVMDADDECPTVPMGDRPDPAHRGCPQGDRDSDGVLDADDLCVDTPQGDHPDPARRGCPVADRDGDGVLDPDDQCVDVAQGEHPDPTRRGCPEGDRDSDGVLDSADQCVDVPAGPRPSTMRLGCPAPDQDHDNIIDQPEGPDRCPTQPETFNGVQDDDGCPDGETLAVMSGGQVRILQAVNFRTDRDEIVGRRSFRVLDSVISILRAAQQFRVDVQGHTDDRGSATHNLDLSNRRAATVRRYLMAHDIVEGRLESHGFGSSCPAVAGSSAAARHANRRVQFMIVTPETPAGRCADASR